ncbi:hypothetical protein [Photorhabdus heterorhabditis]|uniref:hypothetical protein n=1 Tax=Photorhabdus heterorhabditis TaxID=880156 RepID=UPI0015626732|nr:hypothetical protein [Photorhabdus heterorhabditis]NRN30155.1 hypothetical protein [Photorhabdus heterorhabditis subsp. aluminescens]
MLAALTPVTELSMLLGIRSLAAALQIEIYWVYMLPGIRSLAVAMHLEIHRVYILYRFFKFDKIKDW